MVTTLEIITGLSQAIANSHDGALTKDGEPIKIGLNREEGNPINDSRVMDGFSVVYSGNKLRVTYQSEIMIKDVHKPGFENEINAKLSSIVRFIRKEYQAVTGNSISLAPVKDQETHILVQNLSLIRTWVKANKWYTIGGLKADAAESQNDPKVDPNKDMIRKWIEMKNEPAKPKNVKIAKNANAKKEKK